MPAEVTAAIIALAASVGGIVLGAWLVRRKTQAEAANQRAQAEKAEAETNEIIRQTVMGLIEPLQQQVKHMQAEIDRLCAEVEQYKAELDKQRVALERQGRRNKSLWRYIEQLLEVIRALTQQLKDAGIPPCAEPPDWDGESDQ
jgi:predicted RNase H-like nuclease (RuvC/YqgF family)